jgi:ribonuclease HI
MKSTYSVYTDGSCIGNPGPIGWAALIIKDNELTVDNVHVIFGADSKGTSNRAELSATLLGISHVADGHLNIYTDSHYVIHRIAKYLNPKKRNGVRGKNADIWDVFDLWLRHRRLLRVGKISFEQVKGHNGDPLHNWADAIARQVVRMTYKKCKHPINSPWDDDLAVKIIERSFEALNHIREKGNTLNPTAVKIFSLLVEQAIKRKSLFELRLYTSAVYLTL